MRVSIQEARARGWVAPTSPGKTLAEDKPSRAKKREVEGEEQALLIRRVRQAWPVLGLLLIHIPNGGSRKNAFEGWRLKQQGARAGVSDLLLPVPRGGAHGLWIEFKATPPWDAAPSPEQLDWLARMREQGYEAYLCLGVEAAYARIAAYLSQ
jgi:hypothetical protein